MAKRTPRKTQLSAEVVWRRWQAKFALCVALDLIDFTVGRLFGFGILTDLLLTVIAVMLFGPIGLLQLWEVADPTNQIDGFVPTLSLLAWRARPSRPKMLQRGV